MRVRILPYRSASGGARELSRALGIPRLRTEGSQWQARPGDRIINWGMATAQLPRSWLIHARWFNYPANVAIARDKLLTFQCLATASVPTVRWTTRQEEAEAWLATGPVVVRHSLTGQGGSGIEIVQSGPLPDAPLYTQFWPATHEYRVHVAPTREVRVAKKRRRNGVERAQVRNYENGYVYCTENVQVPDGLAAEAIQAVEALGLNFGAVDVLMNKRGEMRVLEVNTAPGLEGSTIEWYAEQFKEALA